MNFPPEILFPVILLFLKTGTFLPLRLFSTVTIINFLKMVPCYRYFIRYLYLILKRTLLRVHSYSLNVTGWALGTDMSADLAANGILASIAVNFFVLLSAW